MFVVIRVDESAIRRLSARFAAAGKKSPRAVMRALNHTGDKAATAVTRALVKQTGAKYRTVRKALSRRRASTARLEFKIHATGGHLSLKEFSARQGRKGVTAKPWNRKELFESAFMGPKPGAIALRLRGHVFVRTSAKRTPIAKLWGPAIPKEMVKDESKAAFERTAATELPPRLEHELARLIGGV